jgi:elongation factor Ts
MADVTAGMVKELREKTGLPMMDCKQALAEVKGDMEAAVKYLREKGEKIKETRLGRETEAGRIAVYADVASAKGAMIEFKCESAPVAGSPETKQFVNDLAKVFATSNATTAEELLKQPAPSKPGMTLGEQMDDMFNRIREVFKLGRVVKFDSSSGGYAHHDGSMGALVEVEGGNNEVAKDVAMHIVGKKPIVVSRDEIDPAAVEAERNLQADMARKEGKPENIIAKMIEGRMRNFYVERALLDQPFVKEETKTVAQLCDEAKMKVKRFVHWELGKE